VLGQVLGRVPEIFVLVDDGDLAEPVTHAPMHLVVDQTLDALLRSFAVFGDRSQERQKTADEPTAIGAIERAGRARPEMLFDVVFVEL
jgi:hypothetical protein